MADPEASQRLASWYAGTPVYDSERGRCTRGGQSEIGGRADDSPACEWAVHGAGTAVCSAGLMQRAG